MKTTQLLDAWKGMAPDNPRDRLNTSQVWLMRDYIPRVLGSLLESRSPWAYWAGASSPLNGPVRAQKWISTLGLNHHLAVTASRIYNLDVPGSPAQIGSDLLGGGGDNPIASLYEFVGIPRKDNALPVFLQYTVAGGSTPTVLTTHATTPKAKFIESWNAYFVVANYTDADGPHPSRIAWLGPGFKITSGSTPAFDTKAWLDTSNDVTALGKTRTALLAFHANGVERIRGSIPPGTDRQDDLWLEPLIGLGGCTAPHTVTYWNDNVLFCDGRGAYISDGTTIRDLSAQGGISRAWRERYRNGMRMAGGIYADFWVISALDEGAGGTVMDCWVCDLYSRHWLLFTNVPVASFATAFDSRERLLGGTWDGKIIDLSRVWDESDPLAVNLDGNGVPVLPQLETGWYRMSKQEAAKRLREAYLSLDLDEEAGALNVYACQQVQPRTSGVGAGQDWILLKTLRMADLDAVLPLVDARGYVRRKIPVGLESYGFAFKLETTGQLRNLKLYDFAVEGPLAREESYA